MRCAGASSVTVAPVSSVTVRASARAWADAKIAQRCNRQRKHVAQRHARRCANARARRAQSPSDPGRPMRRLGVVPARSNRRVQMPRFAKACLAATPRPASRTRRRAASNARRRNRGSRSASLRGAALSLAQLLAGRTLPRAVVERGPNCVTRGTAHRPRAERIVQRAAHRFGGEDETPRECPARPKNLPTERSTTRPPRSVSPMRATCAGFVGIGEGLVDDQRAAAHRELFMPAKQDIGRDALGRRIVRVRDDHVIDPVPQSSRRVWTHRASSRDAPRVRKWAHIPRT